MTEVQSRRSPANVLPGQTVLDAGVVVNVNPVIQVDKTVADRREKSPGHQPEQQQADEGRLVSR